MKKLFLVLLFALTTIPAFATETGLDSKMAKEVRINLWSIGMEEKFKPAHEYIQEMLEDQNSTSEQVTQVEIPEELEIALSNI